jgi:hypothetical protein
VGIGLEWAVSYGVCAGGGSRPAQADNGAKDAVAHTHTLSLRAPKEPIRNLSGKPRLMTSALRAAMPTHGDNGGNVFGGP